MPENNLSSAAKAAVESTAKPQVTEKTKSPFKEWIDDLIDKYVDIFSFWKQRKLVLTQPHITINDPDKKLKYGPLKFALHIIVVPTVIIGTVSSLAGFLGLKQPDQNDKILLAITKAQDRVAVSARQQGVAKFDDLVDLPDELRVQLDMANIGTTIIRPNYDAETKVLEAVSREFQQVKRFNGFQSDISGFFYPLSILLISVVFRALLAKYRQAYPNCANADRVYLYYVTSRLFLPNLILAVSIYGVVLLASQEIALPIVVFMTALFGILQLWLLKKAAAPVRSVLGLDHGSLASNRYFVENRLAGAALLVNFPLLSILFICITAFKLIAVRA